MFGLKSPGELAQSISKKAKHKRIQMNITQSELAERSGVSFGSIKRFEQKGEISLKHLIQVAIVLRAADGLDALFKPQPHHSIDDVIREKGKKERKRAGRNDS